MADDILCRCPTCGAPYQAERPLVDLERNLFICRQGQARVTPREAEVLSVIVEGFPRVVSVSRIVARVYGVLEPDSAVGCVRVIICRVRPSLRKLGWAIRTGSARGYALERAAGGRA